MTEDEIRDLFREMRATPVPADSLVRVRSRLEGRMRRRGRWKIAPWAVAAVAVLLAAVVFRPAPVIRKPAREKVNIHRAGVLESHVLPVSGAEMPRPAARRAIHRTHRIIDSSKSQLPVIIEIETPDPDVVIRLIGE